MEDHKNYNPLKIEAKWKKIWEEKKIYKADLDSAKKPFYNLMMFPYPSAEGLHVGSVFTFTGVDTYGRFKRMQGYDVFEPMGLDGFGIHSENYAIKIGRHPIEQAKRSEENFYRQLSSIGNSFDWSRKLETYDPNYYKWTQWIFIQLFKKGLAYRKKAPVNFCPSCKTVLSDEQVIDGKCERCYTVVEKKELEQWFFAITKYAERLLNNIPKLNWTEKVKIAQREWIGKKEGTEIEFRIKNSELIIKVFTTRGDTLFGATFLVLAPEHPIVSVIPNSFQHLGIPKQVRDDVQKYVEQATQKTEIERGAEGKEKTGVFSGLYAVNPINNQEIPVWIADYALMGYGTGALFGDAHDERDVVFAKKYKIPLKATLITGNKKRDERILALKECFTGDGTLIDSGEFTGLSSSDARKRVAEWLEKNKKGGRKVTYHLRDWLISRQRYWGPPIPLVFCPNCAEKLKTKNLKSSNKGELDNPGWIAVPEEELPVLLPDVEDWRPEGTGVSPLANHPEFYKTKCPKCKEEARRETDVSDTFLDSAWYFFRYIGTDLNNVAFPMRKNEILKQVQDDSIRLKWLPVTMYIGGAEHSVLHLLYSRFTTMVFKDLGLIDFEEPFARFYAHGLIIKDGAKMSKSRGNVINPDDYLAKYGVDTLRAYLRFVGPFDMGGDFRDSGIEGMERFLKRVWRLFDAVIASETSLTGEAKQSHSNQEIASSHTAPRNDNKRIMHKTIKGVTSDLENLRFNTAIAKIMTWYNYLNSKLPLRSEASKTQNSKVTREELVVFVKLLAPFTPFIAEELWEMLGEEFSVHRSMWPAFDQKVLEEGEVTVVVQVNGKTRSAIELKTQNLKLKTEVEKIAKENDKIKKYLEGKEVKKVIYVEGKIINFVV